MGGSCWLDVCPAYGLAVALVARCIMQSLDWTLFPLPCRDVIDVGRLVASHGVPWRRRTALCGGWVLKVSGCNQSPLPLTHSVSLVLDCCIFQRRSNVATLPMLL